jgi:DNA protection during starvation protein 2
LLQIILASENVANLKNRKYHRNVESKRFRELHSYFEELYSASFERIDEIAERIRAL